jgi:hypothetical protein
MYALCRSWGLDMAALPTEPSTTLPVGGLNLIADAELAAPDVPAEPGASGPADP